MAKKKKAATEPSHPMQPVVLDVEGDTRFKANKLVVWLWLAMKRRDPKLCEDLLETLFPDEDRGQFYQLIGYTTSGYAELLGVPEWTIDIALAEALRLKE